MKTTTTIATIFLATLACAPAWGQGSVKGSDGKSMDRDGLQRTIEGLSLKTAILQYLNSVGSVSDDPKWAKAKARIGTEAARKVLADDIWNSHYKAGGTECRDQFPGADAKAWTQVGVKKATVCFDLEALYTDYRDRGLDAEATYKELAKLSFHEAVHHFQPKSGMGNPLKERAYEDESNEVGAYVWWTAVSGTMPTMRWSEQPVAPAAPVQAAEPNISGIYYANLIEKAGWISGQGTFLRVVTNAPYLKIDKIGPEVQLTFCKDSAYKRSKTCEPYYFTTLRLNGSDVYGYLDARGVLSSAFNIRVLRGDGGTYALTFTFGAGTSTYTVPLTKQ